MLSASKLGCLQGRQLLRSLLCWLCTALVSSVIAALIMARLRLGEAALGLCSGSINFLAAFAAGASLGRVRDQGLLYSACVSAAVITVALLTVGFMAAGEDMSSAGILSVVCFTFTGCISGSAVLAVIASRGRSRRRGK